MYTEDSVVISTPSSEIFGKALSSKLNTRMILAQTKIWPDREIIVRIPEDITGKRVIIAHSTYPGSDAVLQLLFLKDAALRAGACEIILVVPYFSYARQDRVSKPGEPVSALVLAEWYLHDEVTCKNKEPDMSKGFRGRVKIKALVTADIHNPNIFSYLGERFINISAMPVLGKYLKEMGVEFLLAPDKGSIERVRLAAEVSGLPYGHLDKKRISETEVEIRTGNLNIRGRKVALVDDIISTGGTIAKAAEVLKKEGVSLVGAACIHGLFIKDAFSLLSGLDFLVTTDTVALPVNIPEGLRSRIFVHSAAEPLAARVFELMMSKD